MKVFIKICLILFLVSVCSDMVHACDCRPKKELTVEDWNDVEIIFVACLEKFERGFQASSLRFEIKEVFKGDLKENDITIYFQTTGNHRLIHHIKEIEEGQDWIVFAKKEVRAGKTYYRLQDSQIPSFCALSKPISKDIAPFEQDQVQYLSETKKRANGFQKFQNLKGITIAEGNLKKGIPYAEWRYYTDLGDLKSSGFYTNGKRDGQWNLYKKNQDGETIIIQKDFYDKGKIYEVQHYNFIGNIRYKKSFKEDIIITTNYNKDGVITSETVKKTDKRLLSSVRYYPDGSKKEEMKVGEDGSYSQVWYNKKGEIIRSADYAGRQGKNQQK